MKSKVLIGLSLLALGVTSCKKEVEFDQANYDNYVKQAFVVDNVDPYHRWATMGSASATVKVNLSSDNTYTVKIYDKNPVGNSQLTLLAQGTVTDGSSVTMPFSYQLSQSYAFVTLFDEEGYMTVYPTAIKNGLLEANIGGATATAPSRRAGITPQFKFASAPDDADFKTAVPAGALLASAYGNDTKDALHNYVLKETTETQNTNFYNGHFALYVTGTKNINYSQPGDGAREMYFYILPGAHLTFKYNKYAQNGKGNFKMYVAKGATVTFEAGNSSNIKLYNRGTVIVQGNGASGVYGEGLVYNEGVIKYQGTGSDYVQSIPPYGANVSSSLVIANSESQFVNAGTLEAKGLRVEGSGHFLNLGTATITGYTIVNSNNCTWVNDGSYTTENYFYTAGSTDVINNCKLVVNDLFYIGLGDTQVNSFQLNGAASVVTKNFTFKGPGFIKMGAQSLFHVKETASMGITKDVYGIYGPSTGDNAVFQAKKIERLSGVNSNQGFVANYFGHLYVATDDHFNFGYSDKTADQVAAGEVGNQPYYRLDSSSGASMTTYDGAKATFSDEGCSAVYKGTPTPPRPEAPLTYMYCFEDNFPVAGDYDFNDAVLTVTPSVNDKVVTLTVSLKAVGATKTIGAAIRLVGINSSDLTSMEVTQPFASPEGQGMGTYNNIDTQETFVPGGFAPNNTSSMVVVLFKDAHWAMNPTQASVGGVQRNFYNTVKRTVNNANAAYVEAPVATYTLTFNDAEKAKDMLKNEIYDVFIVEPYGSTYWEVHTIPYKTDQVITPMKPDGYAQAHGSSTPWAVAVPITATSNFKYPIEWQVIGTKHSGVLGGAYQTAGHAFGEWAENHTMATDWYEYPTSGLVFE